MRIGFFEWFDNLWVGHRLAVIFFSLLLFYFIGRLISEAFL